MEHSLTYLSEIMKKYIPDQEAIKKLIGEHSYAQYVKAYGELRLHASVDAGHSFRCGIVASKGANLTRVRDLLRFTVEGFPSCCGINIFHNFCTDEYALSRMGEAGQELIDDLMNAIVRANKYPSGTIFGRSNRIEVVMVEYRPNVSTDLAKEVKPVDKPQINYQSLWNYFHKHARKVNTRLGVNLNTNNVLHMMEVIL